MSCNQSSGTFFKTSLRFLKEILPRICLWSLLHREDSNSRSQDLQDKLTETFCFGVLRIERTV